MKNYLKVDVATSRLVMDKTFAKNCAIAGSAEYNLLQAARKDYPSFAVVQRTIKRNEKKECYRGLTYNYMKAYIASHESEKNAEVVLAELEEMILISKCHSMGYRYPTIKAWFLEKYPEIAAFGMTAEQEEQEEQENQEAQEVQENLEDQEVQENQEVKKAS